MSTRAALAWLQLELTIQPIVEGHGDVARFPSSFAVSSGKHKCGLCESAGQFDSHAVNSLAKPE